MQASPFAQTENRRIGPKNAPAPISGFNRELIRAHSQSVLGRENKLIFSAL
jgi:hypothetical protein